MWTLKSELHMLIEHLLFNLINVVEVTTTGHFAVLCRITKGILCLHINVLPSLCHFLGMLPSFLDPMKFEVCIL